MGVILTRISSNKIALVSPLIFKLGQMPAESLVDERDVVFGPALVLPLDTSEQQDGPPLEVKGEQRTIRMSSDLQLQISHLSRESQSSQQKTQSSMAAD